MKAVLFWSGGKDSALALHRAVKRDDVEVEKLLTSFSEETERSSIHGVSEELIEAQTESIGLELEKVRIPENCSMREYQEVTAEKLDELADQGFEAAVFGDIFLESALEKRKETMEKTDLETVLPIWGEDTERLAEEFVEKFEAYTACVNQEIEDLAGERIDESFLENLPEEVDPCGEYGEFHSFVFGRPNFSRELKVRATEKVRRNLEGKTKFYSGLEKI